MYCKTIIQVAAALLVLGLSAASAQDGFARIETEDQFRKHVVGKKMWLDDNYVTVKKNGKVTGNFGGKKLDGAWQWRDGHWCRTLKTHSQDTDCQSWAVNGNQFRVTRNFGKGKGFTYTTK